MIQKSTEDSRGVDAPLRLGVVGCGGIASTVHLPILSLLRDRFVVAAVCDRVSNRAQESAARYGVNRHFSTVAAMLDAVDLDVVVVLTPSHEDIVELALDRRLDVITEKPLSLDPDRGRALARRAKDMGVRLEVGLMRLHDPALEACRREFPVGVARSASFYKCDGADLQRRLQLLPDNTRPYTFDDSPPPHLPPGLDPAQISALKMLLWSGAHLLSVLVVLFPGAHASAVHLSAAEDAIACNLVGARGEPIQLLVTSTEVPFYEEKIRLIALERVGEMDFESPYQLPGTTTLTVHRSVPSTLTSTRHIFNESSFRRMWEAMYRRLRREDTEAWCSLEIELGVEDLALALARTLR